MLMCSIRLIMKSRYCLIRMLLLFSFTRQCLLRLTSSSKSMTATPGAPDATISEEHGAPAMPL